MKRAIRTRNLLIFAFATWTYGALAATDVLSLQTAFQKAKDYSPDIRQLRRQYDSARAKAWVALAPAEPTFSVSFNDMKSGLQHS